MILEKITLLNQTILECFSENDEKKIIKAFTDVGVKVLGADFGFVWLNSSSFIEFELVYKSSNIPYTPKPPRKRGRNYKVIKNSSPDFVTDVEKTQDAKYVSKYMKSFVIIPICYQDKIYGNMVFCFKKKEVFPDEKKILSFFIGNSTAQAITIHRLIASEYEARVLSQKNEAYFRALIKNSNEIIMLVDEKTKINYVSSSVYKICGYEPAEMISHQIEEFLYQENPRKLQSYLKKIVSKPDEDHVEEFQTKHKNGSIRVIEATALNMLDNPSIKGIVVNIRDITERKKTEKMKETEILLEKEKLKNEFIANTTHELRTPLAIIKGNVDLALLPAGVKGRRYSDSALRHIDEEVKHLSKMLSDLTMLSSSSADLSKRMIYDRVNLSELILKLTRRFKAVASRKNISIRTKKIPNLFIFGDQIYLEKVFANLIKNSISYGNKNGRTVIDMKKTRKMIEITVIDNGIGISKEDLPHVFERFYRADKSRSSGGSRIGLGLAIVKWVVEAHGGKVEAQANPKKGTTFRVYLPAKD